MVIQYAPEKAKNADAIIQVYGASQSTLNKLYTSLQEIYGAAPDWSFPVEQEQEQDDDDDADTTNDDLSGFFGATTTPPPPPTTTTTTTLEEQDSTF